MSVIEISFELTVYLTEEERKQIEIKAEKQSAVTSIKSMFRRFISTASQDVPQKNVDSSTYASNALHTYSYVGFDVRGC